MAVGEGERWAQDGSPDAERKGAAGEEDSLATERKGTAGEEGAPASERKGEAGEESSPPAERKGTAGQEGSLAVERKGNDWRGDAPASNPPPPAKGTFPAKKIPASPTNRQFHADITNLITIS